MSLGFVKEPYTIYGSERIPQIETFWVDVEEEFKEGEDFSEFLNEVAQDINDVAHTISSREDFDGFAVEPFVYDVGRLFITVFIHYWIRVEQTPTEIGPVERPEDV